jgi:dTDP-glucose 4,6-dehydratase
MQMKKVLITGAAGFIGSHLCEKFLDEGFSVIGMDNFLTGSTDNIVHLMGNPAFKFIRYDVTNFIYIPDKLDIVLHFACPASPVDYMKYPIETLKVDSLGTLNTLGIAKAKFAKYVIASTSEIYGDPEVHPQPEDYWGSVNPIGPRSVYDEAKRFSESAAMAYYRHHGVRCRLVRIFNTYGPRMRLDDGRVVPNFISQALKTKNLTVYGDGTQTRSFCYIDDLVAAIYKVATLEGIDGQVFNLGNPEEFRIIDFAKLVIASTGASSKIVFRPLPPDDPKMRRPDITRARKTLGWQPKIPIEKGLKLTISYLNDRIQKESGSILGKALKPAGIRARQIANAAAMSLLPSDFAQTVPARRSASGD